MKPVFAETILVKALAVTGFLILGATAVAAADLSLPVTGNLLGVVADGGGIPQMGATVQLFNKYERLMAKTVTAPDGRFAFAALPADVYSVRVSLASFLPASRDKIPVRPGLDSVLEIHLATLFSSIELSYTLPAGTMSNDWKWVLRSSPATRPITRLLDEDEQTSASNTLHPRIFSGTHAMLSINGGDGGLIDSDSTQADLGTGFVVSTNVLGKNQLQVGGTFGQGVGPSAMGLCAIYSRSDNGGLGEAPEVTLTISQLGILGPQVQGSQASVAGAGFTGAAPVVRDMSLSIYEVADPVDGVHLEYGMTGESVESEQPTSRVSPFARLTVDAGAAGRFVAAYSDGGRPDELSAHQVEQVSEGGAGTDDMLSAVNALARLPELSDRDGRLELQRAQSYEFGYSRTEASRTWAASAFYEDVSNGRIYVAGNTSALDANDLLSDGVSTTSAYNIGHYDRSGYLASVNQRVNDALDIALAYGRMGGFTTDANSMGQSGGTEDKFLAERNHNLATTNVHTHLPRAGTQITANYGWVDSGAVIPRHIFTTQNMYVSPGLNIMIRQPLPSFFGMPGRLELTADLRNLLAQGYLPLNGGGDRSLLVVQAPRAIRGSLNFIF